MIRKPSDTQAVGLHLDGASLKLVSLENVRGKVKVKRLEEFLLKEEGEAIHFLSDGEDRICHTICDKALTVAALDGKDTLIRRLRIKLLREKDIEEAFPFEAEGSLPYPVEEGVIDKIYVNKEEDYTNLTLLSCRNEALSSFLSKFHDLKLEPEVVTCTPAALAAFAGQYTQVEENLIVVYCGENTALSAVVNKGKLLSSHSLSVGTHSLKEAFEVDMARDPELLPSSLQQLDFTSDDLMIAASLNKTLVKLKQDISWMILSELKGVKSTKPLPLLFLGEGANLKGLDKKLLEDIPCERLELETPDGMELNQSLLKKFAIAIGSALTALPKYPDPINFRQGDLSYPEPWKRFKGALVIFTASSLLLAGLIFLFGLAYNSYQEDLLREKYVQLLSEMQKSYPQFEKEYNSKVLGLKGEALDEIIPPKNLTLEEISSRLDLLQKEIQAQPDLFPLLPNSPLVSDTIAWLSAHPKMKGEEGAIKIENFNYQMVKRPEMNKKGERYQVKVDLEISAPTPSMAREFHTALISPNDFIDPKAEVKWSSNRGKYQTSFYLKDKTVYLPVSK